jgi:hypothetical protein
MQIPHTPLPRDLDALCAEIRLEFEARTPAPTISLVKDFAAGLDASLPNLSPKEIGATLLLTQSCLGTLTELFPSWRDERAIRVINFVALLGCRLYSGWPE